VKEKNQDEKVKKERRQQKRKLKLELMNKINRKESLKKQQKQVQRNNVKQNKILQVTKKMMKMSFPIWMTLIIPIQVLNVLGVISLVVKHHWLGCGVCPSWWHIKCNSKYQEFVSMDADTLKNASLQ